MVDKTHIEELNLKVHGACKALESAPNSQSNFTEILEVLDFAKPELDRENLMAIFDLDRTHLTSVWQRTGIGSDQKTKVGAAGAILDIATILGFAPTDAELQKVLLSSGIPLENFGVEAFRVADAWVEIANDNARARVWTAFAGLTKEPNENDTDLDQGQKKSPMLRGLKAEEFVTIYKETLAHGLLQPRPPNILHAFNGAGLVDRLKISKERRPELFNRMNLPIGISHFSQDGSIRKGLRSFLDNSTVPYFSFADDANTGKMAVEKVILESIRKSATFNISIIFGPGGVGKTRLGHETLVQLDPTHTCIEVMPNVEPTAIEKFKKELIRTKKSKIVILVDYVESCRELETLCTELEKYSNETKSTVSLIFTCRASALEQVTDRIADFRESTTALNFGDSAAELDLRNEFIALQILNHFGIQDEIPQGHGFRKLPMLACYAASIHQSDLSNFRSFFSDEKEPLDFRSWVKKRATILVNKSGVTLESLTTLLCNLPCSRPTLETFLSDERRRSLFEDLKADQWIEEIGSNVSVSHDLFSDAIFASYISHGDILERTLQLTRTALQQSTHKSFFRTINRSVGREGLRHLNGTHFLDLLNERNPSIDNSTWLEILDCNFIPAEDLYYVLGRQKWLRDIAIREEILDPKLGRTARLLSGKSKSLRAENSAFHDGFVEILSEAVARNSRSNQSLVSALQFYPVKFLDVARREIYQYPTALSSSFLIKAYLKSGGEVSEIEDAIIQWMGQNLQTKSAGYVFPEWIHSGGNIENIEEFIYQWLLDFSSWHGADYVYSRFWYKTTDIEATKKLSEKWLVKQEIASEIQVYSIQNYLQVVECPSTKILNHFRSILDSSNFGQPFVDAPILGALIQLGPVDGTLMERIESWMKLHHLHSSAFWVFEPLIKKYPSLFDDHLFHKWASINISHELPTWKILAMSETLSLFLTKTNFSLESLELIKRYLDLDHGDTPNFHVIAVFVKFRKPEAFSYLELAFRKILTNATQEKFERNYYGALFHNHKRPMDYVNELRSYLAKNRTNPEARWPLQRAIHALGGGEQLEPELSEWLTENLHEPEISFVFQEIAKSDEKMTRFLALAEEFVGKNQESAGAIVVQGGIDLLNLYNSREDGLPWREFIDVEYSHVYTLQQDLQSEDHDEVKLLIEIEHWLSKFSLSPNACFLFAAIFASGFRCKKFAPAAIECLSKNCEKNRAATILSHSEIYQEDQSIASACFKIWASKNLEKTETLDPIRVFLENGAADRKLSAKLEAWMKDNHNRFEKATVISTLKAFK